MEVSVSDNIVSILKRFFRHDPNFFQNKSENDLIDASEYTLIKI